MTQFSLEPILTRSDPGFENILRLLRSGKPFSFCKLNHGFWERLSVIEDIGYKLSDLASLGEEDLQKVDERVGAAGTYFAESGFLSELLALFQEMPDPANGFHFVPSLLPWPLSDRIEGTPLRPLGHCEELIRRYIPKSTIDHAKNMGFTGHEMKYSMITGTFPAFLSTVMPRDIVAVCNPSNRALFDKVSFRSIRFVEASETQARFDRENILQHINRTISQTEVGSDLPLVISMIGGELDSWLGIQLHRSQYPLQYLDVGAAFYAFNEKFASTSNWRQAYSHQLSTSIRRMAIGPELNDAYEKPYGIRNADLVELAVEMGVEPPNKVREKPVDIKEPLKDLKFVENKLYDHHRIQQLLALSERANHHANYGPVVRLLEKMLHRLMGLPESRRVVAVNSGTSALHVAAGVCSYLRGGRSLCWVTSAFNFFSAKSGPLASSRLVDCDSSGRIDMERLKAIEPESYDGVIFTNVFSQHTNWRDVFDLCAQRGHSLIVDNATGLMDRPPFSLGDQAPMEIVSFHHTKPWGVGEGGILICNSEEESVARRIINFGVGLDDWARMFSSNHKISDLAAVGIIDRVEKFDLWNKFYRWQERRIKSIVIDSGLPLEALAGQTSPVSPRAYTPFVCNVGVGIAEDAAPEIIRKYYRPLSGGGNEDFANAERLYANIACISNNPINRVLSNDELIDVIRSELEFGHRGS